MNVNHRFKMSMVTLTACSTLALSCVVKAQSTTEEKKHFSQIEEIVATGSRIQRAEFSQPVPVVSIDAEEISRYGTPDLGSILAEFPAIGATATLSGNTSGSDDANGSGGNELAGSSSVDLRRLGENRTLVLVNGKRHVAGVAGSAQVDLSTIPSALVERIDMLTGGASGVYGSDAVSGVVNLILKDNFEGLELNLSAADSTEGVNNEAYSATLVGGLNFAQDRGNATVFVSMDQIEQTLANDIRQFNNFGTIANPLNNGENDGIPDRLRVPNVVSELINATGVLNPFGGGAGIITFDNAGNPVDQQVRDGTNSFAFGNFVNGCAFCFAPETYENYLPEVDRVSFGSTVNFDITDNDQFYGSFKYVDADVLQLFQPSFRFGNVSINVVDNPYLEADLRQRLLDAGQTSVAFAKFFDELGFRVADNQREVFQYNLGLKGDFKFGGTDIKYDVYYGDGQADNVRTSPNDLIPSNFLAAVDAVIDPATGQPACRSQVPSEQEQGFSNPALVNPGGCVPYNPFGFQQASTDARAYVAGVGTRTDKIEQQVFGATIVTDSSGFFELAGGAIDLVFGYEHREESSSTISDDVIKSGVLTTAATPDTFGEFDVDEFFFETHLPLIKDMRFIKEFAIDASFRAADYSHAGSADAWNVGFLLAPIDGLRFRGSIGEAVRAPSISEAFNAQSPGFADINDPCDADNIGNDPDRAANCAALGIPTGFQANDNVSINVISGGNPDLFSEASDSYTLGFIWQPDLLQGLNVTVDYYNIEITDAIINVTAQNILNNCVDGSGGLDAEFCAQVDRNPVTQDVSLVRSGFLNAAALNTDGVEVLLDYRGIELDKVGLPGNLEIKLVMNKLLELERFEFQNRPDEINVEDGEVGDPSLQYRLSTTYYHLDNLAVNWTARYIDRSARFDVSPTGDTAEDTSPAYLASLTTHDLSTSYSFNEKVNVLLGIRNLLDDVPPGTTKNPLYDLVGRRAFVNLTAKF